MTFAQYIKDKRYFGLLYVALMGFVSFVMALDTHTAGNITYVNAGGLLLAAAYIGIGYLYRNGFYRALREPGLANAEEIADSLPAPQNNKQRLAIELVRRREKTGAERLRRLVDEKRDQQDFIMSWIHEVKLPIAASRLLLENGETMPPETLADKLEDELDKIESDVEQALYYSRIDSFSKDYFITEVSLDAVVKQSVKKVAKRFIHKRIRFAPPADDAGRVHSDVKWLAFIVDQLVSNALKYTLEGGAISFGIEEDDREKRLLVRDTGIGIPPEDIRRVFDKGFTGANGRAHAHSTGMGLYLAKQLALKLGHDLSVRSEAGVFTEVAVHFSKRPDYYRFNEPARS